MNQRRIVLYTRGRSLRCWRARRFLRRAGYGFEVVDASEEPGALARVSKMVHHKVAPPYVLVDDRPLGDLGTVRAMVGSGTFEHVVHDNL